MEFTHRDLLIALGFLVMIVMYFIDKVREKKWSKWSLPMFNGIVTTTGYKTMEQWRTNIMTGEVEIRTFSYNGLVEIDKIHTAIKSVDKELSKPAGYMETEKTSRV